MPRAYRAISASTNYVRETLGFSRALSTNFALARPTVRRMARPKVHHEERVTTAFRLPKDLHHRLQEAAAERDLSANFLAVKALEEFLDHLVPADELRLTRAS